MDEDVKPGTEALEQLRYPIGRFSPEPGLTAARRDALIDDIAALPAALRAAVTDLTGAQLDTPYRPGGWTVRQVVHHVPDSHVNAYIRCKLALTRDRPQITTYDEAEWAKLADARGADIDVSLALLDALHGRWVPFLRSLEPADFERAFVHPEHGPVTLDETLQLYAWHGRHHLAHITSLRRRMQW